MKYAILLNWAPAAALALGLLVLPWRSSAISQFGPVPALAATACGTGNNNHTDQYVGWSDGSEYNSPYDAGWGSSAKITTRLSAFCTGSGDAPVDSIVAFSMIQGNTNYGIHYAQIGYRQSFGGSADYIWAEWTYSGCSPQYGGSYNYCDDIGPKISEGTVHQYFEDYDTAGGFKDEDMGWDTTLQDITLYDPAAAGTEHWTGPWQHYYAGETHNIGDDVPGLSTTHAVFSSVMYESNQNTGGGVPPSFSAISGHYLQQNLARYCYQNNSGTSFDIWSVNSSC